MNTNLVKWNLMRTTRRWDWERWKEVQITVLLVPIKGYVAPGMATYYDCCKSYNCPENEGYNHLTVNHSIHFKNHANSNESTWAAWATNHVKDQFYSYLYEDECSKRKEPAGQHTISWFNLLIFMLKICSYVVFVRQYIKIRLYIVLMVN